MFRKITAAIAATLAATLMLTSCAADSKDPAQSSPNPSKQHASKINWAECKNTKKFECGELEVPLDWKKPDGAKIKIAATRIQAKNGADKAQGTIFVNPGGPGGSGIEYLQSSANQYETLREKYNIAAWDPRGVGKSSPVICFDDKELDEHFFGDPKAAPEPGSQAWLDYAKKENSKFAAGCEKRTGDLYKHVSTVQTVHDLDALRKAVGDEKLNYVGLSYGTFIGAIYADIYGKNVGRFLLDGAVDPAADTKEIILTQTKGFEHAFNNYLADCVKRGCWGNGDVDAHKREIKDLLARYESNPQKTRDGLWVGTGTVMTAMFTTLYSKQSWPILDRVIGELKDGKLDTTVRVASSYYSRDASGRYTDNSHQALTVINCIDKPPVKASLAEMRKSAAELEKAAPVFGKYNGYGEAYCQGWPTEGADAHPPITGKDAPPILVVGTSGDPATPVHWAKALAKQLGKGVFLEFKGEGHVAFRQGNRCVDDAVKGLFFDGKVPQDGAVCR
ncbi:MAG: alpha/beta hydrolase [Microbacteriaceae bacterium]|nr:alpha/beta hydrolase [Microbacteriaceae bacterium]